MTTLWELVKAEIHVFVDLAYVGVEVFSDGGELSTVHTDHSKFVNLSEATKIEQCQADNLETWLKRRTRRRVERGKYSDLR